MKDDDDLPPEERDTALAPRRPDRRAAGPSDHRARDDENEGPQEGSIIDHKYRVERVLGSGGMGIVVSAMHLELGDRVALKFVKVGENAQDVLQRLRREARIAFKIKSEHVARLLDVGTLRSGAPYLVMEHLTGRDLAAVLDERGRLPVAEAVDYLLQACEAMAEAHRLGIVHRDLKPSNLFLTHRADDSAVLKVLDFGIAKAAGVPGEATGPVTGSAAVLGSPLYMSPEQVRGAKAVDLRSDVWSLGVILHELLAGAPPFPPGPGSAVCAAIAADEPERLRACREDAPAQLEAIVLRCLEKRPADRYPNVGALAVALAPFAPEGSKGALRRIAALSRDAPRAERDSMPDVASDPALATPPAGRASGGASGPGITISTWDAQGLARRSRPRYRYVAGVALALAVATGAWALLRGRPSVDGAPLAAPVAESSSTETPTPAVARPVPADTSSPAPEAAATEAPAKSAASAPASRPGVATNPRPVEPRGSASVARVPDVPSSSPSAAAAAAPPATASQAAPPSLTDLEQRATSRRR